MIKYIKRLLIVSMACTPMFIIAYLIKVQGMDYIAVPGVINSLGFLVIGFLTLAGCFEEV